MEKPIRNWILAIDDSPGRYDEFARLLTREGAGFALVIACKPALVEALLKLDCIGAILLDRDMPDRLGEEWAVFLAEQVKLPTLITSTTGCPHVRENMLATLQAAGVNAAACYADHQNCEVEWLWWIRGATGLH